MGKCKSSRAVLFALAALLCVVVIASLCFTDKTDAQAVESQKPVIDLVSAANNSVSIDFLNATEEEFFANVYETDKTGLIYAQDVENNNTRIVFDNKSTFLSYKVDVPIDTAFLKCEFGVFLQDRSNPLYVASSTDNQTWSETELPHGDFGAYKLNIFNFGSGINSKTAYVKFYGKVNGNGPMLSANISNTVSFAAALGNNGKAVDLTDEREVSIATGGTVDSMLEHAFAAQSEGLGSTDKYVCFDESSLLIYKVDVPSEVSTLRLGLRPQSQVATKKLLVESSADLNAWETIGAYGGVVGSVSNISNQITNLKTEGNHKTVYVKVSSDDPYNGNGPLLFSRIFFTHDYYGNTVDLSSESVDISVKDATELNDILSKAYSANRVQNPDPAVGANDDQLIFHKETDNNFICFNEPTAYISFKALIPQNADRLFVSLGALTQPNGGLLHVEYSKDGTVWTGETALDAGVNSITKERDDFGLEESQSVLYVRFYGKLSGNGPLIHAPTQENIHFAAYTAMTVPTAGQAVANAITGSEYDAAFVGAKNGSGNYLYVIKEDGGFTGLSVSGTGGKLTATSAPAAGTYTVTLTATDSVYKQALDFTLNIRVFAPIVFTAKTLPVGLVGQTQYSQTLGEASGGSGAFVYSLDNDGGSGLTLSSLTLSGTLPATAGTYEVTVRAQDTESEFFLDAVVSVKVFATAADALSGVISAAEDALDGALAALGEANYKAEDWNAMVKAVADGKAKFLTIASLADESLIAQYRDETITALQAFLTAAQKDAAQSVKTLIANIGEINSANYAEKLSAIETAETAYAALSAAQKTFVDNYNVLTAARAAFIAQNVQYTVTFKADDGETTATQRVPNGGKLKKPADPKKDGYTFDGWYNGDTLFDFDTAITSELTLTVHWTHNKKSGCGGALNASFSIIVAATLLLLLASFIVRYRNSQKANRTFLSQD